MCNKKRVTGLKDFTEMLRKTNSLPIISIAWFHVISSRELT